MPAKALEQSAVLSRQVRVAHDGGWRCETHPAPHRLTWLRPAPLQSKRQALLASIQELEAQYEELRAEMLPLWERHIALTEALPADLQQV